MLILVVDCRDNCIPSDKMLRCCLWDPEQTTKALPSVQRIHSFGNAVIFPHVPTGEQRGSKQLGYYY